MPDQLLSVSEAAAATQEPANTLRRWIREGVLPVEHVGPTRRVRIRLSVLRRFYPSDILVIRNQTLAS